MKFLLAVLSVLAVTSVAPQYIQMNPRLDKRIVGGQPVDISEFPFQLSLLYFDSHTCGAIIISEIFALSAAHCTHPATSAAGFSVRAGSNLHNSGGVVIPLRTFKNHPYYDPTSADCDITILQFSFRLSFGITIAAVKLPYPGQDWTSGTKSTASGWGALVFGGPATPALQAVSVPILSLNQCRAALERTVVTERMICAGFPQGHRSVCGGDSGGPLVVGDEPILAGIVSWGYGCALPNSPAVYSHVGVLRSFITIFTGI